MNPEGYEKPKTDVVKGKGWCGLYADGNLGFFLSHHIPTFGLSECQEASLTGKSAYPSDMFRVEVTIRALKKKDGKYIVKRNKAVK